MKKRKLEIRLSVILLSVFYTIFWAVLFFIGYFFASSPLFYLTAIGITALTYVFVKKVSKKLAFVLSAVTLLVAVCVFCFGFEEAYCWKKTTDNFQTHMRCHETFTIQNALKESLSL